jgi:glycosyltransferase involved in cell wall biosynthesis
VKYGCPILVTSYVPSRTTGRGLRTCGVITALARLGPVDVAYTPFGGGEPAADLVANDRITLRAIHQSRGLRRFGSAFALTLTGTPWGLAKAASPEMMELLRGADPSDRIIADGPMAAAALLPLARARESVYLAHNLESSFRGTFVLRRWERRVLQGFGESWMATHSDMAAARSLAGDGIGVRYVPNVVDVAALPVADSRPGSHTAIFVADFQYPPNREGLDFLLAEVMPRVWDELPEATLKLVGRGLDLHPDDARVRVLGFVDDLDGVFADADAVMVPLLSGGGSPLKFVEALARAVPVVATSHAARLIEYGTSGEHYIAAPDAAAMADGLVSVLRGEHPEMGARGRELADRHLSVDALARLLADASAERSLA